MPPAGRAVINIVGAINITPDDVAWPGGASAKLAYATANNQKNWGLDNVPGNFTDFSGKTTAYGNAVAIAWGGQGPIVLSLSTTKVSGITFQFDCQGYGTSLTDVEYSVNGGAFTSTGVTALTPVSLPGGGGGSTCAYTLPAAAENAPSLQININFNSWHDPLRKRPAHGHAYPVSPTHSCR